MSQELSLSDDTLEGLRAVADKKGMSPERVDCREGERGTADCDNA